VKTQAQIKQEISSRLKQARESNGYQSAEDFCQKHKISLEVYLQQEKGELSVKASHALQYCKLLGISLNWLLVGDN
jgi:ribosome-binding protein aMBF1 (putative translation factor)